MLLRINRAATHVRWSPLENKFAVASGARLCSISQVLHDVNVFPGLLLSVLLTKKVTGGWLSISRNPSGPRYYLSIGTQTMFYSLPVVLI